MKYLLAALLGLCLLFAASCASGPKAKLDEMTELEAGALERRVAAFTRVGSWALVSEGVLDASDIVKVANALQAIADGTVGIDATAVLSSHFEASGWESAGLLLLLSEADLLLEARNVWGDPSERWRDLMHAAADAILEGAAIPEDQQALAESVDEEIAGLDG